jgi:hypothetical protein
MAFQNATNRSRVNKAIEYVRLIEHSADANRTPAAQVRSMLHPLMAKLSPYLDVPFPAPPAPPTTASGGATPKPGSHASWQSIRKAAEEAPLEDLTAALHIYLDRVQVLLDGRPK